MPTPSDASVLPGSVLPGLDRKHRRELALLLERYPDVAKLPWPEYLKFVRKSHELVYGMKYGTGTLFVTPDEMLKTYPKIAEVLSRQQGFRPGEHSENMQELLRIFAIHNYLEAGAKDFYLYSDLVPMLRDTDLPDIPSTEVAYPFEAFSLSFKQGSLPLANWKNFDRAVVSCVNGRRLFGVLLGENYDGAPPFVANLDETISLKQIDCEKREIPGAAPDTIQRSIFRLIMNTLLYINCDNADVVRDTSRQDALQEKLAAINNPKKKKTRRQKQLEQDLAKARNTYIYIVGKNVRADAAYKAVPANEEGRKILKRFRVRGHWRNQAYGPQRSLVKRRWIAPYWKGPNMAELINHGYVLKLQGEGK